MKRVSKLLEHLLDKSTPRVNPVVSLERYIMLKTRHIFMRDKWFLVRLRGGVDFIKVRVALWDGTNSDVFVEMESYFTKSKFI